MWRAPWERCRLWPRLSRAGGLSYAKVRALTRVATPETEARLLRVGRAGTASHVERIVRGWRCVDRKAEARETKRHQRRSRLPSAPVGHALQAPTLSAMFRAPDQPERSRMAIAIRVEHIGLAAEA